MWTVATSAWGVTRSVTVIAIERMPLAMTDEEPVCALARAAATRTVRSTRERRAVRVIVPPDVREGRRESLCASVWRRTFVLGRARAGTAAEFRGARGRSP